MGPLCCTPDHCPIASGASVSSGDTPFPTSELTAPSSETTRTQAAAGALIRPRLASLLGLQVKEEGHHICKRGGVTGAAAPQAVFPEGPRARREREEFLSPPPRAEEPRTLLLVSGQRERPLAHGRSCQAPTLWPHVPRLLAWEQDRWCPSCFSISSLDLRSQLVGGSHFRQPPLPPPQTLLSSPLPPLAGFLPCTSSLGPGSPAPPPPPHPRGGPHLAGSCTAGSLPAARRPRPGPPPGSGGGPPPSASSGRPGARSRALPPAGRPAPSQSCLGSRGCGGWCSSSPRAPSGRRGSAV